MPGNNTGKLLLLHPCCAIVVRVDCMAFARESSTDRIRQLAVCDVFVCYDRSMDAQKLRSIRPHDDCSTRWSLAVCARDDEHDDDRGVLRSLLALDAERQIARLLADPCRREPGEEIDMAGVGRQLYAT